MVRDPTGAVIRNLFDLQRLANSLRGEARAAVQCIIDDAVAALARHDPTSVAGRYQRGRSAKVLAESQEAIQRELGKLRTRMRSNLARIGKQQGNWASEQLLGEVALGGEAAVTVIKKGLTINYFKRIIDTDPFEGHTLAEWLDITGRATQRRITRAVRIGMVNNETIDQIVRRIRGRSIGRGRYAGGVLKRSTFEAETVARTAVNAIASRAHFETYRQNDDITTSYRYTATLDNRTSDICRALDGRVFKYGEGPIPPQHPNCRSTLVPEINWEDLGLEPPPVGTRASADGQVSSAQSYETWLRGKSAAEQNEILGKSRGKLFRSGVSLRDMVRSDGSTITVAELEARG